MGRGWGLIANEWHLRATVITLADCSLLVISRRGCKVNEMRPPWLHTNWCSSICIMRPPLEILLWLFWQPVDWDSSLSLYYIDIADIFARAGNTRARAAKCTHYACTSARHDYANSRSSRILTCTANLLLIERVCVHVRWELGAVCGFLGRLPTLPSILIIN